MNLKQQLEKCEADNAKLREMAIEFGAFMNYVIVKHGKNDSYDVDRDDLAAIQPLPVRTEFINSPVSGRKIAMRFTRFDPSKPDESISLIIKP